MNAGQTLFAQVMDFLPLHQFRRCVQRYRGEHQVQSFSCLDRFLSMAFAQRTYRRSLRDVEACLRAAGAKVYPMGFRSPVARSTLADANDARDGRIYADLAMVLIGQARQLYAGEDLGLDLDATVYALDSTTIDLCLSLFPWARSPRTKGAVKRHTLLNLRGSQIWIAIAVYVLIAIIKKQLKLPASLYTILQVLSVTLLEKTPILQVLSPCHAADANTPDRNQLYLYCNRYLLSEGADRRCIGHGYP
jgi:hypothetical protein